MCQPKSSLRTVQPVYGFKWGLKTRRDEKAIITQIGCKAFNMYIHTRVSIGHRTCRQSKVVTMCLVRIFRHTSELSTTLASPLRQLALSCSHMINNFNEKENTVIPLHIEIGVLYGKLSSCVAPLRAPRTSHFTRGSH